MLKAEDIRELTDEEIAERLQELREERFKLRFRAATMQLENPSLLGTLRRDIARLNTILHERHRASAQG